MSSKNWKIINSHLVFDHKWYKLRRDKVELPNGRVVDDYFVSVRPDVAVIFALTKTGDVVLVKQYKHGVRDVVVELPGGIIDEGESPEGAARRELREETGYDAEKFIFLGNLIDNPTKDTNKINIFLAPNAEKVTTQKFDENEDIEVLTVALEDLQKELLEGSIKVSGSVAGIYLALAYLNKTNLSKT